jgi:hypothetical protein
MRGSAQIRAELNRETSLTGGHLQTVLNLSSRLLTIFGQKMAPEASFCHRVISQLVHSI